LIICFFALLQIFGNLVAFEDADIKKTSKGNDRRYLADSVEHNPALGNVLPARADLARTSRHRDVFGAVAQPDEPDALLSVCKPARLLCDADDHNIDLLHAHLDKGMSRDKCRSLSER
jgi:hypothetical protein